MDTISGTYKKSIVPSVLLLVCKCHFRGGDFLVSHPGITRFARPCGRPPFRRGVRDERRNGGIFRSLRWVIHANGHSVFRLYAIWALLAQIGNVSPLMYIH